MANWWQNLPYHMDPVLFQIGSFRVQYYGLMYIVAFGLTYALVVYRTRTETRFKISLDDINGLTTSMVLGLIIGARLGYVLFYNLDYYSQHPLQVILPFDPADGFAFTGIAGMSYHGGLIGVVIATYLYVRKSEFSIFTVGDLYAPAVPLGYTFGRLGNFINGELWGRATTSPIGMHFPLAPDEALRHPSQLYEAFFEGIFLFVVFWLLRKKIRRPEGVFLSLYLFGYGFVRFFIEFFRQPDTQLGFVFARFSMGQVLCGFMMLAAVALYFYLKNREA